MTDFTPNAPVQMAGIEWSATVCVSFEVTGAPGIQAPCGHLLQPKAFLAAYRRGTLEDMTISWDLDEWKIYVTHPSTTPFGKPMELTLTQRHFGEGPALEVPDDFTDAMTAVLRDMGMEIPDIPKAELLGPVPSWVHTALKTYQPETTLQPPVRTSATYHSS